MSTTAELRARDSAITAKRNETLHEQQQLLDQHIDIQVCDSVDQCCLFPDKACDDPSRIRLTGYFRCCRNSLQQAK